MQEETKEEGKKGQNENVKADAGKTTTGQEEAKADEEKESKGEKSPETPKEASKDQDDKSPGSSNEKMDRYFEESKDSDVLRMSYDEDEDDDETICLSEPKIVPSKDGEANPLMDKLLEDNT